MSRLSGASPLAKVLMAVAITSGVVVVYRMFYAPYVKRKRYQVAEEWANKIIEYEEQTEETKASISTSQISY